jgi:tRNA pseudouridine38-40 synthase
MAYRYKLTISYDGTEYAGWQVQSNAIAIQPLIQQALATVLRHPVDLSGSGRTDAGVHARGQTAHFDSNAPIIPPLLRVSLNALLPPDIRILEIEPVEQTFHARYSAKSKVYHYYLHLDPVLDPFSRKYSHQVFGKFNINDLKLGAEQFLGTHDFTSFANVKPQPLVDAIRTILSIDITPQKGGIRLEFTGNGFLYKMVRNITGTLIDIGLGKLKPEAVPTILLARDRKAAGSAAPAKGLFLHSVNY